MTNQDGKELALFYPTSRQGGSTISIRLRKCKYLILLIPLLFGHGNLTGEWVAACEGNNSSTHSLYYTLVADDNLYISPSFLDHATSVDRSERRGPPFLLYKSSAISQRRERAIMWGIILGLLLGAVFLCLFGWFILKMTKFGKK
ncbi:hypothetical protein CEE39_03270 [bacterium (candidate division B38) B3_B38]|nr:MAG: hypothetical protein CEE39_03270 [bacterium (candidate division B38) B3_B38]